MKDILKLKKKLPRLFAVNKHLERNEGLKKSLAKEAVGQADAIIILSGFLKKDGKTGWRTTNFNEGKNFKGLGDRLRIVAGAHSYKEVTLKNPRVVVLVSGGSGSLRKISDAPAVSDIMKKELIALHVPRIKIIKEKNSRNTFENLLESDKICAKRRWRSAIIISNEYHLPRIKTMIEYYADKMPHLASMFFAGWLKLMPAEKICLSHDRQKWAIAIKKAYKSRVMKKRLQLEKQGVADIKKGGYKFADKKSQMA